MAIAAHHELGDALRHARTRTLALVEPFSDDELERVHTTLMSPLSGTSATSPPSRTSGSSTATAAAICCAASSPRSTTPSRRRAPTAATSRSCARQASRVPRRGARARARGARARTAPATGHARDGRPPRAPAQRDDAPDAVARRTAPAVIARGPRAPARASRAGSRYPADRSRSGAAGDGFAYDNERPRHEAEVRHVPDGRTPVTNATWLTFTEGGGYERREWWSDEGWAWKEEYDITHHRAGRDGGSGRPRDADRPPRVHVSWFEADAFARAHGARLPTEAEWERAATWNQEPLAQIG